MIPYEVVVFVLKQKHNLLNFNRPLSKFTVICNKTDNDT